MNKIDELKEQTEIVYILIKDYEDIQKEMAIAREETTEFAKRLGMDQFVAKNHPSVMSYLELFINNKSVQNALVAAFKNSSTFPMAEVSSIFSITANSRAKRSIAA